MQVWSARTPEIFRLLASRIVTRTLNLPRRARLLLHALHAAGRRGRLSA
jgi:hypothetical protein